jgi:predicted metal-dependent hydrolase
MFRHAEPPMLDHLANFMLSKKIADSTAIDSFIATHRDEIRRTRKQRISTLVTDGRHFDLKEVLDRVVARYFGGRADVRIGWGNAPRRLHKRRRTKSFSRALATYSYDDGVIRVSPVLDAENVPSYVIDWIVYHELLHHVLPVMKSGAKHIYHSAKFRSLERGFEHYEKAKAWEETHMEQLLR